MANAGFTGNWCLDSVNPNVLLDSSVIRGIVTSCPLNSFSFHIFPRITFLHRSVAWSGCDDPFPSRRKLQLFAHSVLYCDDPFPSRLRLQLFAHSVLYCDDPLPSRRKLQPFAHSVLYCDDPLPSRRKLQPFAHSVLYCDDPFPSIPP